MWTKKMMSDNGASFLARKARVQDASILPGTSADVPGYGELSAAVFHDFLDEARSWIERALGSGDYIGWLGTKGGLVREEEALVLTRLLPRHRAIRHGWQKSRG
jgi:hypothetical protein